jgi:hypothetical protein
MNRSQLFSIIVLLVVSSFSLAATGCESRNIQIEAMVFYRVVNFVPGEDLCNIFVAIPMPSSTEYNITVRTIESACYSHALKSFYLGDTSQENNMKCDYKVQGHVIDVSDDNIIYFEPEFSPVVGREPLCSKIKMEAGEVKYIWIDLVDKDDDRNLEPASIRFSHSVQREPMFRK